MTCFGMGRFLCVIVEHPVLKHVRELVKVEMTVKYYVYLHLINEISSENYKQENYI